MGQARRSIDGLGQEGSQVALQQCLVPWWYSSACELSSVR